MNVELASFDDGRVTFTLIDVGDTKTATELVCNNMGQHTLSATIVRADGRRIAERCPPGETRLAIPDGEPFVHRNAEQTRKIDGVGLAVRFPG